jgi:hypothetical protein
LDEIILISLINKNNSKKKEKTLRQENKKILVFCDLSQNIL